LPSGARARVGVDRLSGLASVAGFSLRMSMICVVLRWGTSSHRTTGFSSTSESDAPGVSPVLAGLETHSAKPALAVGLEPGAQGALPDLPGHPARRDVLSSQDVLPDAPGLARIKVRGEQPGDDVA